MSFKNNSPTFSYISWNSCYITYDGIDYIIEDGYTCMKYVYWDYNNPYKFIVSNLLQDETITKQLIAVNDRGMVSTVELDNITLTFTENSSDGISGQITSGLVALYDKQQSDGNDYNEKFATVEVALNEISTLMGELEATDDGLNERISSLQQTAEGISMEVSNVQKEYSKDKEHMELRDEIGEALIVFNSELGLFTSDLNDVMKDNSLSTTEKTALTTRINNLTKYKNNIDTIISKIVSKISSENGNVVPLQEEKVAFGNAFSNLMTTYNTVISDGSFTTAEMTSITGVIGTMNTKCITLGNVLEEIILLPFNGKLIEELSKLSIKSNEILLGVYENGKSAELNSEKIAELRVTADGISTQVSKVETNLNELGNDLHNNYSTTTRMNSAIEQTAEGIKSTVSSVQNSVNTNTNNINSLTTRISNAEQKITSDAITNTVSSVYTTKEEFNNLTIGATNLVKDGDCTDLKNYSVTNPSCVTAHTSANGTNTTYFHVFNTTATSAEWTGIYQFFAYEPPIGQQYTASMEYYADRNAFDSDLSLEIKGVRKSGGEDVVIGGIYIYKDNLIHQKWTRIHITVTINEEFSRIYVYPFVTRRGSVYIDHIQVEKGNKLTEWHASPKDLEGTVGAIEERVSKAEQKITADAITSTVTSSQSWANQTNSINNLSSRMSTAEQKITADAIVNTVTSSNNWSNQTNNITKAQNTANTNTNSINNLSSRVSTAEQKITADAIVSTVTGSSNWKTQTTNITNAQNTANTANSTANTNKSNISALTTRVSTAEQKITSSAIISTVTSSSNWTTQTNNISAAQSTANTAKSTADTNKSNISALTTRVSTAEQKITSTAIISTVTSSSNWTTQTNNISAAQNAANAAQSTANTANSTANTAKTNAANAQSTANTANTNANSALTKANTNASNITTVQSSVAQLSNKISWMVKSGSSQSNMTLTDTMYSLISNNITLTASRINLHGYVTANNGFSIDSSGTVTMTGAKIQGSGSGNKITINNADYEIQTGGTTKGFFGLRTLDDNIETPRLAMGPSGIDKNNHNYFVMTAYPWNNNPLNNSQNYIDMAYRTHTYWTNDTSGDVSNIRMLDDGDIHIAPVRNLIIKSSYNNGYHDNSSSEKNLATFKSVDWDDINSALDIDCIVRDVKGSSKGLCFGVSNANNDYAWVRLCNDSNNYKFFAPYHSNNDISLGSTGYLWSRVCAVNGTINTSDRRLKENVQYIHETPNSRTIKSTEYTLRDMYDFVKDDLAMTTYTMKDDEEQKLKYGFIAQDIIDTKIGYNIISQDNEGNFLGYDTMNYTSAIAGALKQSINEIEKLKEEINILKNEITELKK